jgi:hypothetical protein
MSHQKHRRVLVIANETTAGQALADALRWRAALVPVKTTVLCPVSRQSRGFVVYEEARRAAAQVRLERTLSRLRGYYLDVDGRVVETDPVAAACDAVAELSPDEIIVSTHPERSSGWIRGGVVDRIRSETGLPVEHVVADVSPLGSEASVLVVANLTVVCDSLLDRIRARARRSPARFLIVCPQDDTSGRWHPDAERRLRQTLRTLRNEGIDAAGHVAHPEPRLAALEAADEQHVDEIIVCTLPDERSTWLRRNVVERVQRATGLPVEHLVVDPNRAQQLTAA